MIGLPVSSVLRGNRSLSAACRELIERLEVGRAIEVDSVHWRVAGRVVASEMGETWAECRLESGSEVRWLSVETGTGSPEVAVWRRGDAAGAGFDLDRLTLDGRPTELVERGVGEFVAEGDCSVRGIEIPPSGEVIYQVHRCPELGELIALEWFSGSPVLVGRGRRVTTPGGVG